MKLTTFSKAGQEGTTYGVVANEQVLDLPLADRIRDSAGAVRGNSLPATLKEYIARSKGRLEPAADLLGWVAEANSDYPGLFTPVREAKIHPPIPDPGKFICVGKNNLAHLDELKRNDLIKEVPSEPTGFIKLASCLSGQDAEVARPEGIVEFDYEPELAFVIGVPAYRVGRAQAMDYVFGVSLLNDLTAREIQRREVASGTRFWTSKNMPGFGPVGPYLVTLDEIGDPHDLWLTCSVNGAPRMRVSTGQQIYRIPDIIEHFSRHLPLEPGDMFSTGSAGGVAVGMSNASELFLRPGDLVEVAIEGVMALRTRIIT